MEVWKEVKGYEGLYEISTFGRIKSMERIKLNQGKHPFIQKERILKQCKNGNGYLNVSLNKNSNEYKIETHKLMAYNFLNHEPQKHKLVIDHIDNIRENNKLDNLQIISNRENCSKDKKTGTSKFVGVYFSKKKNRFISEIRIGKVKKYLGSFNCEIEAHLSYQKELKSIENER